MKERGRGVVERIGVLMGILPTSLFEGIPHCVHPLAGLWSFYPDSTPG